MTGGSLKQKLRVLTLIDGIGAVGGGERVAWQVAAGLDRDRFESALCVTRASTGADESEALADLELAGVRLIRLGRRSRADLRAWVRLVRSLRDHPVDVIHSHKIGSNLWGALISRPARAAAFVAHEHTWAYSGNPARALLDRHLVARRADAVVAVSREDRRRMIEVERIPAEKTRLIPNGLAVPRDVDRDGAAAREELGIALGSPVVGVVAALRPQKAIEVLIEASATLIRDHPELVVLVVGGDDGARRESDRLRERAAALGVGSAVRMLGTRTDVPRLLAAMDVGVLSSDYEGSPLAVLEYMEAGLPVVSTEVGGVPDIVEHEVTGLLVPPRNPHALAAAVGRILADRGLAARMGSEGRRRRRERFDIANTIRDVEQLYEGLAGRAPGGAPRPR